MVALVMTISAAYDGGRRKVKAAAGGGREAREWLRACSHSVG